VRIGDRFGNGFCTSHDRHVSFGNVIQLKIESQLIAAHVCSEKNLWDDVENCGGYSTY
jgi:hypothetical protein